MATNDPTQTRQQPDPAAASPESEMVKMTVGGKDFQLNVPKGMADEDIVRGAINNDDEFAKHASLDENTAGIYAQEQARKRSRIEPPPATDILSNIRHPDTKAMQAYANMGEEREQQQGAPIAAKTMITAGAVPAAIGLLPAGAGVLATSAAAGAGAAAGSVAGDLATANKPDLGEAAKSGAIAAGGGLLIGGASKLISPFLTRAAVPAADAALASGMTGRVDALKDMAQAEEGIRQSVAAAPRTIRATKIAAAYPKIQGGVDVWPAAKEAITGGGTAPVLGKIQQIGGDIQNVQKILTGQIGDAGAEQALLNEAGSTLPIDPQHLDDITQTLQDLQARKQVSFTQAQNLRSALGRVLARSEGYKLPPEVYTSVKHVNDLLDGSMRNTAAAEGKLAQWDKAQALYKQFMADFYNKDAPLKSILNTKPGQTGKVFSAVTKSDAMNGPRIEQALRRWDMNDEADGVRKVLDRGKNAKGDISDMRQIAASPKAYQDAKLAEARTANQAQVDATNKDLQAKRAAITGGAKKVVGSAVKTGARLAGLETVYEAGRNAGKVASMGNKE